MFIWPKMSLWLNFPPMLLQVNFPFYFLEPNLTHSVFSAKNVNSRATDHIVCYKDLLTTITTVTQTMVELPNGETARVTHIRTITLSSKPILKMFCVFLLFLSIFYPLAWLPNHKLVTLFFFLHIVLYRILSTSKRLEWGMSLKAFTYYNVPACLKLCPLLLTFSPHIILVLF